LKQSRHWYALILLFLALSSGAKAAAQPAEKPATPEFSQEPFLIESLKSVYRFEADGTGSRRVETKVRVQ